MTILSVAEELNTISFPDDGVNTALPEALNELPFETVTFPLNVEIPATSRVLPRVVAPVPTVNVLDPVTDVFPLRETDPVPVEKVFAPVTDVLPLRVTFPVPVEKVPVPDCVKFPLKNPSPRTVRVPVILWFPKISTNPPDPPLGDKRMFPVEFPPRIRELLSVV
jgi:hypothetical protein